jgi:hypothetical protein
VRRTERSALSGEVELVLDIRTVTLGPSSDFNKARDAVLVVGGDLSFVSHVRGVSGDLGGVGGSLGVG